jgi:hypothetical protein
MAIVKRFSRNVQCPPYSPNRPAGYPPGSFDIAVPARLFAHRNATTAMPSDKGDTAPYSKKAIFKRFARKVQCRPYSPHRLPGHLPGSFGIASIARFFVHRNAIPAMRSNKGTLHIIQKQLFSSDLLVRCSVPLILRIVRPVIRPARSASPYLPDSSPITT